MLFRSLDFTTAAADADDRATLAEVPVRVTGFLNRGEDGTIRLDRFVVGCCVADAALLEGDLQRAAQYLNEFVQNAPHVPALTKLVEICVDAELNWMMREAQGRLAAALKDAGREAEAQAILDDLEHGLLAEEKPEEVVDEDFFADLGDRVDMTAPAPAPAAPVPTPPAPALAPTPEPAAE